MAWLRNRRSAFASALRISWRRYGLLVIALAALAALILGFIGFSLQQPAWPVASRLYATVELFHLYTDSTKPPNNLYLAIAQWLAPFAVGYAVFRALKVIFGQQITKFRISRMRDHLVICGLGRSGIRLARSFRQGTDHRPPMSVVVIDPNPTVSDLLECSDLGIQVLVGDAKDVAVLHQAGLHRAQDLIAVCGDDAVDSEVASAALSLVGSKRNHRLLRCFIHIGDQQLSEELEKLALGVASDREAQSTQIEWFNVYRLAPRALLNSDPDLVKSKDGQSPHVIVVGGSELGHNLVAEIARQWSLDQHAKRIRITVVANDAKEQCDVLKAEFTDLHRVCDLVAVSVDAAKRSSAHPLVIDLPSGHVQTTAFVCVADDDECLRATIQVREVLPVDVKVVTCTTGSSGVATFLRTRTKALSNVVEFPLLDIALTPDVLLDMAKEQIAQALHGYYFESRQMHPQLEDPQVRARVPWGDLPESIRQANRAKASSIGAQLDELGFRLVRNDAWRSPAHIFNETHVVEIAMREHERWCIQKKQEGWRFNRQRNDHKKLNPYIVDWAELPDAIQEIDRDFARRLPNAVAVAGYSIVHKSR